MRTKSMAAMALVLLLGASVGVSAQMNTEEIPATFVTGTAGEGGTATESEGTVVYEQVVDWSDPRLPSALRVNATWYVYGDVPAALEDQEPEVIDDYLVMVTEMNVLLDGSEGSWRGTGRAIEQGVGPDPDRHYSSYVLTGEGAYEGMHALLRGEPGHDANGPWDERYEGWIIEGEVPPLPDPIEPPAE
jgi:hypothetical protein